MHDYPGFIYSSLVRYKKPFYSRVLSYGCARFLKAPKNTFLVPQYLKTEKSMFYTSLRDVFM